MRDRGEERVTSSNKKVGQRSYEGDEGQWPVGRPADKCCWAKMGMEVLRPVTTTAYMLYKLLQPVSR